MTDPESVSWARFAFASATVVALMALLGWGLKVVAARGWLTRRDRTQRINLVASLPLDGRRRLVIARFDDVDYHLLLGAGGDILLSHRPALPLSPQNNTDGSPS